MKKYIWVFAACIMIAGVITVVACSKDNDNNQNFQYSAYSAKGGSTLNQLRDVMVAYYAACDSAYQADSTVFLSVCANNDISGFLNMTNISNETIAAFSSLALKELDEYLKDNPDFKPDNILCSDFSLPLLGKTISLTSGHLASIVSSNLGMNNRIYLENCIYLYSMNKSNDVVIGLSAGIGEEYLLYSIRRSLDSAVCELNHLCNIAYQKDSLSLLQICDDNNISDFLRMTGVSQKLLSEIVIFATHGLNVFQQLNPDYQFDDKPCSSCGSFALPHYGNQLWITHGHLPASYEYYDYPIDSWDCTRRCYTNYSNYEDRAYCIAQCENYLMLRDDNLIMY